MKLHEELNMANNNINISNQILDQTNKVSMFPEFRNDFTQRYNSFASRLFFAINYDTTRCSQCGINLFNYNIYFSLIFPLEEVHKFVYQNNNNQFNIININNNNNVIDIYQCFEFDRRVSLMSGDNAMFCGFCQRSTDYYTCTNLAYGPNVLIIILNRGKENIKLNIYEDLNLNNYIEINTTGVYYKLIGVVAIIDNNIFAFCKDPYANIWYKFNDAIVSPVENFKNEVIDYAMPYLLFYQKENI